MKTLTLPGSKSITNRDLILASLAEGTTVLNGVLESDDTMYMMKALEDLGIGIEKNGLEVKIQGGVNKIKGNNQILFLGNSGTSTRFLTGLALLNKTGSITITGEKRMIERPISELIEGIKQLGVKIESDNGKFPVTIHPGEITGNTVVMDGSTSSQYFTSLLQVAPLLPNGLHLEVKGDLVSKPYIDITINEMRKFGVEVKNNNYQSFSIVPQNYKSINLNIEGDASALSYIALYYILHGGEILIKNIGSDSFQGDYKFLDICKIFGLHYTSDGKTTTLKAPGLKKFDHGKISEIMPAPRSRGDNRGNPWLNFEEMPDVSLTFMILAMFLPGKTKITGLQTLNLKECRRIDAMRDEMRKLGVEVESDEESITIRKFNIEEWRNGDIEAGIVKIETYNDHRIAMCFGVLNTFIGGLEILNPKCVSKTYPNFWSDLEKLSEPQISTD